MNNKRNVELFIDKVIEAIIESDDIVKDAAKIQELRDKLVDEYSLDIDKLNSNEIVHNLTCSKYKYFYKHLNFEDIANVIFLNRIEEYDMKSSMQKMIEGMNEKNYHNSIYSYDEFYKEIYGIELTNIDVYLGITEENQKLEMKSNFATFIEYYYGTAEGKAFINEYQKNSVNGLMPESFFNEIFDKMNKASVVQNITKNEETGKYSYKSGGAGDLDGLFVIFDDESNMTFNVSTTASKNVAIEKTSVLRHAITSKFISEAIVKEIDKELYANNLNLPLYKEGKEYLKKDRSDLWDFYASTEESKAVFVKRALTAHIEKHKLKIKVDFDGTYDGKTLTESQKVQRIIKQLNAHDPNKFINKILNTVGKITENKINVYFKSGNDFKTNFVTNLTGIRDTVRFAKSKLKDNMDKSKIGMFEFKTFLQTSTLKNITLKSYIKDFDKNAVDNFFDNIVVRRVFAKLNQNRMNDKKFLQDVERLIINDLILKPKKEIEANKSFLNVNDLEHLDHYLKYILFNKKDDIQDFQKNLGYIEEKLKNLGIVSTPMEILNKIKENYPELVEKADDLIDKSVIETERDSLKVKVDEANAKIDKIQSEKDEAIKQAAQKATDEANENMRNYFVNNGLPIPDQFQIKKLPENDGIDYTSGQKEVLDLGTSSIKSPHKNVSTPTIKNKIN